MRIYGVDFTSAPKRSKPIAVALCELADGELRWQGYLALLGFDEFEAFLDRSGPWVAGLDFPFGQPRKLIEDLGWPGCWAGYVKHVSGMSLRAFADTLAQYRSGRPPGAKHLYRHTDLRASACSPMMLHGVPVGRMFYHGAPRLLRSGASIVPCCPVGGRRVVVEAYPALVARRFIGQRSYKSDDRRKQTPEREEARRALVAGLCSDLLGADYDLQLALEDSQVESLVGDPSGDRLDALLCAIQAAWAHSRRGQGYGVPRDCDPLEGWIVDPSTLDHMNG